MAYSFGLDWTVGYELPVSYLYTDKENILLNPKGYMELSSHSYFDIILPFIEYRIKLDLIGYKLTLADL